MRISAVETSAVALTPPFVAVVLFIAATTGQNETILYLISALLSVCMQQTLMLV